MPGVEQGIGGNKHGQIVYPNAAEYLAATRASQPFADDKAVLPEQGHLLGVEPEIVQPEVVDAWDEAQVVDVRVGVELGPELGGRRIPIELFEIGALDGIPGRELIRGDLADCC